MFHKKSGLKPIGMRPSTWLYDQLKRFRADIEAWDLLSEALLRAGALPLAGLGALQGLRALGDFHPQPGAPGAAAAMADLIGYRRRRASTGTCARLARYARPAGSAAPPPTTAPRDGVTARQKRRNARVPGHPESTVADPQQAIPQRKTAVYGHELAKLDHSPIRPSPRRSLAARLRTYRDFPQTGDAALAVGTVFQPLRRFWTARPLRLERYHSSAVDTACPSGKY